MAIEEQLQCVETRPMNDDERNHPLLKLAMYGCPLLLLVLLFAKFGYTPPFRVPKEPVVNGEAHFIAQLPQRGTYLVELVYLTTTLEERDAVLESLRSMPRLACNSQSDWATVELASLTEGSAILESAGSPTGLIWGVDGKSAGMILCHAKVEPGRFAVRTRVRLPDGVLATVKHYITIAPAVH